MKCNVTQGTGIREALGHDDSSTVTSAGQRGCWRPNSLCRETTAIMLGALSASGGILVNSVLFVRTVGTDEE